MGPRVFNIHRTFLSVCVTCDAAAAATTAVLNSFLCLRAFSKSKTEINTNGWRRLFSPAVIVMVGGAKLLLGENDDGGGVIDDGRVKKTFQVAELKSSRNVAD